MYKKALIAVCEGTLCQATAAENGIVIHTRENGRVLRRQMALPCGKIFGARQAGYGDAVFEFPFATLEILGEEMWYANKTASGT